jgi:hypothetical protein
MLLPKLLRGAPGDGPSLPTGWAPWAPGLRAHQIHSTAQGQRTQAMRLLQPGPRNSGAFHSAMELNNLIWKSNGNYCFLGNIHVTPGLSTRCHP